MVGLARVFVEVFGCSANQADAEIASGLLDQAGHTVVGSPEIADALVVLTCTVKTPTEKRVVKRISELSASKVPLVVAGCMPKAQPELVEGAAPDACMVGPDDLLGIVDAVEAAIRGKRIVENSRGPAERTCLPRVRANPVVHIAPISTGCLGDCSYCIVKRARGRIHSYPADLIVEDAKRALEEGCREIWLTAEDTAAYHWNGTRLPGLLEELTAMDGKFYIRVGMMTPNQAGSILDDLLEAYRSGKVYKFLHAPVQSGNDSVLTAMNRRYTVDTFRALVGAFRGAYPSLSLSTDIICGFPGETDGQFDDSIRLVEEVVPDVLNISRFWPRPGTEAEAMEGQHHGRVTKMRSRRMSDRWRRLSSDINRRWIGWMGEVVVDEQGRDGSMVGRNNAYKPVVIKEPLELGEIVKVRVTEAGTGYLVGQIVD
ncbi:MAG: tRNA (N(6)-L-threonylcarbamoyladenosine(37)-C(2))-methylthiotransferase [Candidatus Bathyarchaeota archaeon]|nr:MAG: tRNA (N(6)-L-threonylcarbamoyladenosine(37)-C(2))-methylthiotransferase [Candidatus Bathyarchaeota archaeon]